ncbi:hypothetical protein FE810_09030 [Thalassotalea litorea]|uniref:Uncharacterized protein n=1 Tax=Thalassotalea litorea TaxID=2020715 RepID=A0A5R9IP76_9GAMM|nr:hypothetical protein [Thalassotalea litorea]TLU65061.1 hypothetical protein FE810_09030 [Thalassotalea litorea]
MKSIQRITLKGLRKTYSRISSNGTELRNWKLFSQKQYSNDLIYNTLVRESPCMIGRIGSTEMLAVTNYIGVKSTRSVIDYIKGKSFPWWWEKSTLDQMQNWSGFFPAKEEKLEEFCELMLTDICEVDILGSWLNDEKYLSKQLANAKRVVLEDLEPFFTAAPWTRALTGKKVLVIHPFAEAIKSQYKNRKLLFDNDLLPEFELKTIKAVQSIAGEKTEFIDWFEALEHMKSQMEATDYDICILGCGAYGFPLAAHAKRKGKKAIHLGGVTQLLFGIKGNRWEDYIVWPYKNLFNEHWIRPGKNLKPLDAEKVENACYW